MKTLLSAVAVLCTIASSAFAQVSVQSPQPGHTLSNGTSFVATAKSSTCSKGAASMGIYIDNQLKYVGNGNAMNTTLSLTPGNHNAVVQSWDFCGGATKTAVPLTVDGQGVVITAPANNATIPWNGTYAAAATTTCSQGISKMGLFVDNQLVYTTNGSTLNTQVNLTPGKHATAVESWDKCGGNNVSNVVNVNVSNSGNNFTQIQTAQNWYSWAQIAPYYQDCDAPCTGVEFSMQQKVS